MGRKVLFAAILLLTVFSGRYQAATLTVCASGCTYDNSQLQTALDAAAAGDTILLQEGATYTGTFSLPRHGGASYVTVRTGVTAAGAVIASSQFPAANIRMTGALATSSNLAMIRANSNNASALKTADPSGGTAPEYWRIERMKFGSNVSTDWVGSGSIITCGSDSNSVVTTYTEIAAHFQLSQVYVTGDPTTGQFRGISAHCNDFTIQDSTVEHIKSKTEGQALWCNSFEDGLTVTNTVLSGGTEVMMCGGGSGAARPAATIEASPVPTQTSATISRHDGLRVGKSVTVNVGGVEQQTEIASCGGVTTYWAPCQSGAVTFTAGTLTAAPDVPGDIDWGLNPGGVVVTKSVITRPTSHRNVILGTPQSVTGASATTGGTLAAGTYNYRVVARMKIASSQSDNMAQSAASTEVPAMTTGSTSTTTIRWAPVSGATEYRVYGRSSGAQNMYWTVLSGACTTTCSYTDTGSTGTTGSVPTSSGTLWFVKNLLELKNCVDCTFEGNIIENTWFQSGGQRYAITLTPSNTGATNDSTQLADIVLRYNKICHAPGGVSISGRDASTTSGSGEATGLTSRVTISHNVFCDINNTAWGDTAHWMLITTKYDPVYVAGQALGPKDLTITHNTIDNATSAYIQFDLYKTSAARPAENFIHRDNLSRKGNYGYFGGNGCSQGSGCTTMFTSGTSVVTPNVMADATCGNYPAGTLCPSSAVLNGEFTDYAAGNYTLKTASVYHNAASDGTDYGADIADIEALTDIALSGDNRGTPVVVPPSITTISLPDSTLGATYSQTISGTCPTTPCTWSSTGTLPTATTLTQVNSTTATIGGPLQAAGTYPFSLTLTDAGGRATTVTYTVTVTQIIAEPDPDPETPVNTTRPDRFNMDERVHFGRAVEPSAGDDTTPPEPVRAGDLWADVGCSTPVLKFLTGTSPTVTWRTLTFRPVLTATTITTAGAATYTAAEIIGGMILRDPNGSGRSDVTPTAALIVAGIPCAAVGDSFEFDVRNTADAAETITLTAGTSVTLSGTMTIAQSNTKRFKAVVTGVTAGSETVTIFSIGTFVH